MNKTMMVKKDKNKVFPSKMLKAAPVLYTHVNEKKFLMTTTIWLTVKKVSTMTFETWSNIKKMLPNIKTFLSIRNHTYKDYTTL